MAGERRMVDFAAREGVQPYVCILANEVRVLGGNLFLRFRLFLESCAALVFDRLLECVVFCSLFTVRCDLCPVDCVASSFLLCVVACVLCAVYTLSLFASTPSCGYFLIVRDFLRASTVDSAE